MSLNLTKFTNEIELTPAIIEFFKNFNKVVADDFVGTILLYDAKISINESNYKLAVEFHMDKFDDRQKFERVYERSVMTNPIKLYQNNFKEVFNKYLIIEQYKFFQKQMNEEKLNTFNERHYKLLKI